MKNRQNQDNQIINDYGKDIMDLCIGTQIRIVNGRTTAYLNGNFTCHKYNDSSSVDYLLFSINKHIISFHVGLEEWFADLSHHSMISVQNVPSKNVILLKKERIKYY